MPGALLALLVHGGLIGALAMGVDWRQRDAEVLSAELWAALPQVAAPQAAAPETALPPAPPAPTPPPPAVPEPTPRITPPAPPPPGPSAADIALEKERARARAADLAEQAAARQQKQEKQEAEALANQKREAAEKAEKARKLASDKAAKAAADKVSKAAADKAAQAAEEQRLEAQRQENLKRLLAQAGGSKTGGTGDAAANAGPSAAYADKLRAFVKGKLRGSTDNLPATLEVVVELRATSTGTVLSRKLTKSSGNATWDTMVMRAVDVTETLPTDETGRVPALIEISFRPK